MRRHTYLFATLTVAIGLAWAVPAQADITTGLVGYWPLDGDATDASGNGFDGTINGAVEPAPDRMGYPDSAMLFPPDAGSHINVGDHPEFQITGEITLAAWVFLHGDTENNCRIIAKGGGSGQRSWNLNIEEQAGGVAYPATFQISDTGAASLSLNDTESLPTDQWAHVAGVYRPGQAMEIYVNGRLRATKTSDVPSAQHGDNGLPVLIGARSGCGNCGWDGFIDEARVYNRALSAADIQELYEFHPAPRLQAWNPDPPDGATGVTTPLLQWKSGVTALFHHIYVGTSPELGPDDQAAALLPAMLTMHWYTPGLESGVTYYWRVDEVEADMTTIHTGNVWSFTAAPVKAYDPKPADAACFVNPDQPELSWTAGMDAISHEVYFGHDANEVAAGAEGTLQATQPLTTFTAGVLENGATYYWRVDETRADGSTVTGDVWSFNTIPDVPIDDPGLVGWWTFDEGEGKTVVDWSGHGRHGALNGDPQWVAGYFDGALDFEFANTNDGVAVTPFDVASGGLTLAAWVRPESFSQNDGRIITKATGTSGNDHWWMLSTIASGPGYTLRFRLKTDDGQDTTTLIAGGGLTANEWTHTAATWDGTAMVAYQDGAEVAREAKGGNAVAVNPGAGVSIGNHLSGGVGNRPWDGLIDDVRVYSRALDPDELQAVMRFDPALAWEPSPHNGATTDAVQAATLTWQPGDLAVRHDVYLGTDRTEVKLADTSDAAGVYRGRRNVAAYSPAPALEWGRQYFWRIDEIRSDGAIAPGFVWSFTVADYLIVDDFESYSNEVGQRVFEVWIDGIGFTQPEPGHPGNGSGAAVGHDIWTPESPYFEGSIMEIGNVFGGSQAMPVYYDNTGMPYYAETERTWSAPQDWTAGGVETLVLHIRGDAGNGVDRLYVEIEDSTGRTGEAVHPDASALTNGQWTPWEIPLADFSASGVVLTGVKKMRIGTGNHGAPAPGGAGVFYVDDIRLTRPEPPGDEEGQ